MKYDFDKLTDRRGTASLKWEVKENELPMWVADMDFQTVPAITTAIEERAASGIFGYSVVPKIWYEAICSWWKSRHNFEIQPEHLVFTTGVVPAISSIIRKMTTPGEKVLIQTPVYNIFFNSIVNNGRSIIENKLKYDGCSYSIDFEDLEEKLSDPQTRLMLLCNPHNPIGKIWDRKTLERIGELCWKHHVLVVSDEIHCDLVDPGCGYIPFASVSEHCRKNSITCLAPTKTFNLAGLQTAAIMAVDELIRYKVERGLNTDEVAEPNAFAITAAVTAFTKGADWLDELRNYLLENKQMVKAFLERELPQVKLVYSEATYLLWLDCGKVSAQSKELAHYIRQQTGLWLSDGESYGESGSGFLRMNIACPRVRLEDGLYRLKQGIIAYEKWTADRF